MKSVEQNGEARRAWLKEEQAPRVKQQTPQSNFEQSWACRIGLLAAAIVIGFAIVSPDPASAAPNVVLATTNGGLHA